MSTGLTEQKLLDKLRTIEGLSKKEKAKACGYATKTKTGKERVNLSAFLNALLEAGGIELDEKSSSKAGRSLSYRTTVQRNGSIIIGAGYTQNMGLKSGQLFEIKLGRNGINLTAIESESVDEFDETIHDDEDFDDDEIV